MQSSSLDELTAAVNKLYQTAEHRLRRHFPRPAISLDLRGRAAGQAWPEQNKLRFNRVLLEENPTDFFQQTVPHEVAHLISYQLFGLHIRPHGKEWRMIMTQLFNRPADTYHQYDITRAANLRFIYRCSCPGKELALSKTRHLRSKAGTVYLCSHCNSPLTFAEEQTESS